MAIPEAGYNRPDGDNQFQSRSLIPPHLRDVDPDVQPEEQPYVGTETSPSKSEALPSTPPPSPLDVPRWHYEDHGRTLVINNPS